MEEEDFFGECDEQEAQRMIAEREFRKLESEFMTMGFRQGALEEIENKEKAALNKGLTDGMDVTQLEGYLHGKIEFVKSFALKFSKRIDEKSNNEVNQRLQDLYKLKRGETSESDIKEAIQQILSIIAQSLQFNQNKSSAQQ